MLLGKNLQILQVLVLDFLCGLDLDGDTGVANDNINLNACISAPVGELLFALSVVKIGDKFLDNKMLEGMTIFSCSPYKIFTM